MCVYTQIVLLTFVKQFIKKYIVYEQNEIFDRLNYKANSKLKQLMFHKLSNNKIKKNMIPNY